MYLLVWKRWSGSVRWQDESWQPKSLMSRQPGSSLGQVPTPRGGPRSGKGSSGVRNFSYEVVADASSDIAGDGLARTPTPARGCSRAGPCPHSNLSAAHCCPGAPGGSQGLLQASQSAPQWPLQPPLPFASEKKAGRCWGWGEGGTVGGQSRMWAWGRVDTHVNVLGPEGNMS